MIRLWIVVLSALVYVSLATAAEETGLVKGSITIGGLPIADAVVSIEGIAPRGQRSKGQLYAVIDQKELKFIPRVIAVPMGKTVDFPNNDKTFHNVFSTSEAKKFDLGLYPPGQSRSVNFDNPGVVSIHCNVHPNMEAYVVVKGHPYFAVPDARGNYSIKDVPVGKYRLEVWHPELGIKSVPVELVRRKEILTVDVDLKK